MKKVYTDNPVLKNLRSSTACCPLLLRLEGDVAAIAIIPDEIEGRPLMNKDGHILQYAQKMAAKRWELCQTPHPVMKQLCEQPTVYSRQALTAAKNRAL